MASDPQDADRARDLLRHEHRFEPGEVIYRDGDTADRAYFMLEGRVRIFKRIGGAERGLSVLGSGELFGQEALLTNAKRTATAISLTPVQVVAFDTDSLEQLITDSPKTGARLVERLALRAREAEERIQISMLRDSQARVILALVRTAQAQPTPPEGARVLHLSPLELSARVGLDVDAVKRAVQQLQDNDYLRISEETLEIPDLEALQELYGLLETGEEILGGARR